jgi:hypothetical protein
MLEAINSADIGIIEGQSASGDKTSRRRQWCSGFQIWPQNNVGLRGKFQTSVKVLLTYAVLRRWSTL